MADMLEPVFADLRERMLRAGAAMTATKDTPGDLVLKTPWDEPGKAEPAWFGAVTRKKNYVSVHLMPLYCLPALMNAVPADLRKRMQGKSCFNFKAVEPDRFEALERLIARCAEAYAEPTGGKPHQALARA